MDRLWIELRMRFNTNGHERWSNLKAWSLVPRFLWSKGGCTLFPRILILNGFFVIINAILIHFVRGFSVVKCLVVVVCLLACFRYSTKMPCFNDDIQGIYKIVNELPLRI